MLVWVACSGSTIKCGKGSAAAHAQRIIDPVASQGCVACSQEHTWTRQCRNSSGGSSPGTSATTVCTSIRAAACTVLPPAAAGCAAGLMSPASPGETLRGAASAGSSCAKYCRDSDSTRVNYHAMAGIMKLGTRTALLN